MNDNTELDAALAEANESIARGEATPAEYRPRDNGYSPDDIVLRKNDTEEILLTTVGNTNLNELPPEIHLQLPVGGSLNGIATMVEGVQAQLATLGSDGSEYQFAQVGIGPDHIVLYLMKEES